MQMVTNNYKWFSVLFKIQSRFAEQNICSKVIAIFYGRLLVIQSDLPVCHLTGFSTFHAQEVPSFLNIEIASCDYKPHFRSIFSKQSREELKKNVILFQKETHEPMRLPEQCTSDIKKTNKQNLKCSEEC